MDEYVQTYLYDDDWPSFHLTDHVWYLRGLGPFSRGEAPLFPEDPYVICP